MIYRSYGKLDDPVERDGDGAFRAINTYLEPTSLEEGTVTESINMRLNGDKASLREGLSFKAGSVTLSYSADTEQVFTSTTFQSPSDSTEYLAFATKDKVILYNSANTSGIDIAYPGGEVVALADKASFVQVFDKLILFRGKNKRPLEWDGDVANDFLVKTSVASGSGIAMPNTEYGLSFRNRVIIPQPTDSPYTLIMSDSLDSNNFVASEAQFRINKGSADKLVAFHGYLEDQIICFMEKSIHMITNVTTPSSAGVIEVTREYGCIARKSIVNSGPQIYFLSDAGIMVLQQGLDPAKGLGVSISKVSGEAKPLTAPIADQIKDINLSAVSGAVSKVFDNKVFFAFPTGSSTVNNTVWVYDILGGAFISKDTFPSGFQIDDFVTLPFGTNPQRRQLFIAGPTGWYQYTGTGATVDDSGRQIGSSASSATTAITGTLTSRSFSLGSGGVKHWKGGQLGVETSNGDALSITLATTDPDSSATVLTHSASTTEEALLRFGGRVRGYSAKVSVSITQGNPKIRHLLVEGSKGQLNGRRSIA
ncbi:hypothetical protein OAK38_06120 [Verrucomicrobia bacterium]|nr:hypothetical protein [Verrucomicrobiota bacterium]